MPANHQGECAGSACECLLQRIEINLAAEILLRGLPNRLQLSVRMVRLI